jgi:hypothetical protein
MQGDMDWSGFAAGDEPSLVEIVRREPGPFFEHWTRETLQGGVRIAAMTASVFPPFLGRRIGGVGLAFATARFLLTPWILCALAAVAIWRDLCRPEPGTGDRRYTIARNAWIAVLACHTAGAVYFTLRLPA